MTSPCPLIEARCKADRSLLSRSTTRCRPAMSRIILQASNEPVEESPTHILKSLILHNIKQLYFIFSVAGLVSNFKSNMSWLNYLFLQPIGEQFYHFHLWSLQSLRSVRSVGKQKFISDISRTLFNQGRNIKMKYKILCPTLVPLLPSICYLQLQVQRTSLF